MTSSISPRPSPSSSTQNAATSPSANAANTRDGVVMLSENTGAHEELGDCALTVNPFDIQEQADAMYRALTMEPEEKAIRADRLREIVDARNPGDWIDEQMADIRQKQAGGERVA